MSSIYLGNCLDILNTLPLNSVDLILTDPPYNISKPNNFSTMSCARQGIDFGAWDYECDILSWIEVAIRVCKKDASIIIFNSYRNISDIVRTCESIGLQTKDLFRFIKHAPFPRNRDRRYISDYELAIWFTMPKAKWVFNRLDPKFQRPEFKCHIDRGLHPTQKPVKLMEHLIQIHSNPGDTILDPFAGSGTTGIAARNLQRNFVLIEQDKNYFEIMKNRLNL